MWDEDVRLRRRFEWVKSIWKNLVDIDFMMVKGKFSKFRSGI